MGYKQTSRCKRKLNTSHATITIFTSCSRLKHKPLYLPDRFMRLKTVLGMMNT